MDTTASPNASEEVVVSLTKSERVWAVSNRVNLISLVLLGVLVLSVVVGRVVGFEPSQIAQLALPVLRPLGLIWWGSAYVSGIAGAIFVLRHSTGRDPREGGKWTIAGLLIAMAPVTIYYFRKRV